MLNGLDGRKALVTGASRGIGRAIAVTLAERGADVAVNYRSEAAGAQEVAAQIEALGRKAVVCQGSVGDPAAIAGLLDAAVGALGGLDILVHNAGVLPRRARVADSDPAEVEEVMRVNAMGPYYLTKLALPYLRQTSRADIIFVSSIATKMMGPGMAAYNMAKAAGEALALTVSKEERERGIRTNIVAPGLTDTDMGEDLIRGLKGDFATAAAHHPFGRAATPHEVANVVAFLVSPENGYVNGQRIYVDGGPTLKT